MRYRLACRIVFVSILLAAVPVAASVPDAEEQYLRARERAECGDTDGARLLCREILQREPARVDARVLLGRLMAIDGDYAGARGELQRVLDYFPENGEARNALEDLERLERSRQVLFRPDMELMMEQAEGPEPVRLQRAVRGETVLRNEVSADYDFENFDDSLDSWHEASVAYKRSARFGSIIGRVNAAQRFDKEGTQFEIDSYPRIRRKTYLYLNVGHSSTDLYPEWRYGAEVYHNFPRGYEASLGFRRLDFSASEVTIYTGTLAKYVGNYWISWRPNYVDKVDGTSFSNGLSVRRYFEDRNEYAEITVGGGTKNAGGVIAGQDDRLDSVRARAELRRRIRPNVVLKGSVGYRSQEFDFGRERQSYFFGVGFEKHF